MSLDVDLRDRLRRLVRVPVQQNYNNQDTSDPRVWYQRQSGQVPVDLSGLPLISETVYAVEVNATDPDVGAALADAITVEAPVGMNGLRGVMGGTMVLACFVEDAADEYVPRIELDTDSGIHVFAFNLRFLH